MKAVVQRVSAATVHVAEECVGAIRTGYVVFLGVAHGDTEEDLEYLARKILGLRIFPDETGRMNRSITEIEGEILLVSQFTLQADTRKGRRPGFDRAAPPDEAVPLYEAMISRLAGEVPVRTGQFGARMSVALTNEGPVTIILESTDRTRRSPS
ncbi:MAG: D-aminoacyl-tRNA deacylase [Spirochaeta sp.]|jgi:D-tyrosyl-tRNA(Tyr) deacylase|nr:D-aminoacyl-tRNA deacylase [Spirochaeta sp.]